MEDNTWIDLSTILDQRFKQGAKSPDRLKTGFLSLDQILGGGLSPGLIILGGTPGVGKSTLALQIATHVAESGHPVLYFSLEMPASRILAKIISRKFYEKASESDELSSLCVTADELLDGTIKEEQWAKIGKGIEEVKNAIPVEHLHICTGSLSASEISERAKLFSDKGKDLNEKKPLVIIDYLQIMRPEKGAQSDKQVVDSSLRCLMELAHNLHGNSTSQQNIDNVDTGDGLPMILISSLNRNSYKGAMQISAFKETGDIEYSADLLLGLQFRNYNNNDQNEEMRKSPREVELTVLKNRYGRTGGTIPLQYDPSHDYFFSQTNEPADEAPVTGPEKQNSKKEAEKPSVSDLEAPPDESGSAHVIIHQEDETPLKTPPKPFSCVINNTMVANELRKGFVSKSPHEFEVIEGINTICSISEPLSSFDCCVADAIYTLEQKQKPISLLAILQILHGCKRVALTKQKWKMLEQSIEHLRAVNFYLSCPQELLKKKVDGQPDWVYGRPDDPDGKFRFLNIIKDPKVKDEKGIYLPAPVDDKGILPLYTYGAMTKQMITVPSTLLNVAGLSNTQDNICLKWFLAHRLEIIRYNGPKTKKTKQDRDHLRTISFQPHKNLYEEFRFGEPFKLTEPLSPDEEQHKKQLHKSMEAQRLKRLHGFMERILKYYEKIGYIAKYGTDKGTGSFKIIGTINDPQDLKALQP